MAAMKNVIKIGGASGSSHKKDFQDTWVRFGRLVAIGRDHENSIATI